jgi:O-antigen/teichoic acid export membrane protein
VTDTSPRLADRAAASSAILVAESTLRIAVTALVAFWMARQLGPDGFGLLNGAMALTAILIVASGLGLDVPAVLRLTSPRPASTSAGLLATVLLMRAVAALPMFAVAAAFAWAFHRDDAQALTVSLVVALSIVGYAPSVLDVWSRAQTQALPLATARLVATLLSAALKLGVLAAGGDLVWLAWVVVIEACVQSAVLALWMARAAPLPAGCWHFDRSLARALLRQSLPLWVTAVLTLVYMKSDLVLVSALTDHAQTGLYALAQKMSEVLYMVPVAVVDSIYPWLWSRRLASTGSTQAPPVDATDQLLFDAAGASAFIAVVLGLLLAVPLIRWLFGEPYAPTVLLFAVHAWTCIAVALDTARQRWLVAANLQRCAPWLAGCGALVAIGLNMALIPWLGALGAASTALAASIVSGVLSSFLWRELRPIGRAQCRALWPWGRLWRSGRHWRVQRGMSWPKGLEHR